MSKVSSVGEKMDWRIGMRYKGFSISVSKPPSGGWLASIETFGPKRGVMAVPGPGRGEPVPGEFDSEHDAVEAAKSHIDRKGAQ
jgi:hypothetical protein